MKKQKMMAPVRLTEQQMKWVEEEAVKTGNSMAAVIRNLVQSKLDGARAASRKLEQIINGKMKSE